MIPKEESHQIEFKLIWKDEYLKQLCGFANSQGGIMYLGVNDNGEVVGLQHTKRLLEEIPNKGVNLMGLVLQVDLLFENGLPCLSITVPQSSQAVSLRGKYYLRSGSTTQLLNSFSLQNFLLKRHNLSWDEIGVETASFEDIDILSVKKFVDLAISANRLTADARNLPIDQLFENLHLMDDAKYIKRHALLAFASDPMRFFPSMSVKIGRFLSETNIVVQDVIESNLFIMIEKVMDILKTKYLKSIISYKGIHREEQLEYPVTALREAILNALIHRDYTGAITQIRVDNDRLEIWNAGMLPEELKIEMLNKQHASIPRNKSLANLFFKAGYIESWGRGTIAISSECKEYGLPPPLFREEFGGFTTEFSTIPATPPATPQVAPQVAPQAREQLTELENKILKLIIEDAGISRSNMGKMLEIRSDTVKEYLQKLKRKGYIERIGGNTNAGSWQVIIYKQ